MRSKSSVVLFGLALIVLGACTSVPPVGDIPASIATAKTSADHNRIADYFAEKAAGYDREAAFHERMGRSYTARPKGEMSSMIAHCRSLREQFLSAAREARALEQAHRQIATAK